MSGGSRYTGSVVGTNTPLIVQTLRVPAAVVAALVSWYIGWEGSFAAASGALVQSIQRVNNDGATPTLTTPEKLNANTDVAATENDSVWLTAPTVISTVVAFGAGAATTSGAFGPQRLWRPPTSRKPLIAGPSTQLAFAGNGAVVAATRNATGFVTFVESDAPQYPRAVRRRGRTRGEWHLRQQTSARRSGETNCATYHDEMRFVQPLDWLAVDQPMIAALFPTGTIFSVSASSSMTPVGAIVVQANMVRASSQTATGARAISAQLVRSSSQTATGARVVRAQVSRVSSLASSGATAIRALLSRSSAAAPTSTARVTAGVVRSSSAAPSGSGVAIKVATVIVQTIVDDWGVVVREAGRRLRIARELRDDLRRRRYARALRSLRQRRDD